MPPCPPGGPAEPSEDEGAADDGRAVAFKLILVAAPFAVVVVLLLLDWWLRSPSP